MGRNNYFSALDAKNAADKAVREAIDSQKQRVFGEIMQHAKNKQYNFRFYPSTYEGCLYPEVYNMLKQYGYGVVCPDDDGKCWEISWDSNSTPALRPSPIPGKWNN